MVDLTELIADAITHHPGNRAGTPESRHQVSVLLARTALQTIAAAGYAVVEEAEINELRAAADPVALGRIKSLVAHATKLVRIERDDARAELTKYRRDADGA